MMLDGKNKTTDEQLEILEFILRKNIKLDTNFTQFILKPLAATGIMALVTILSEKVLLNLNFNFFKYF